jgi:hypothetical protein
MTFLQIANAKAQCCIEIIVTMCWLVVIAMQLWCCITFIFELSNCLWYRTAVPSFSASYLSWIVQEGFSFLFSLSFISSRRLAVCLYVTEKCWTVFIMGRLRKCWYVFIVQNSGPVCVSMNRFFPRWPVVCSFKSWNGSNRVMVSAHSIALFQTFGSQLG